MAWLYRKRGSSKVLRVSIVIMQLQSCTDIKEATNNAIETMGLVETAIILGDLREAYREPIRSRLQVCVTLLDKLEQDPLPCLAWTELQQQAMSTLQTQEVRQQFCTWLLNPKEQNNELWAKGQQSLKRVETENNIICAPEALPALKKHKQVQSETKAATVPKSESAERNTIKLIGQPKCSRCGSALNFDHCPGFIREAGVSCQTFADLPEGHKQLSQIRSQNHWRCPWKTCDFRVAKHNSTSSAEQGGNLSYEQKEEMVWQHQRDCPHIREPRTEP